jgi:hypothetical protein
MIAVLTLLFPTFAVVGLSLVLIGSIVTARAVIIKDDEAIAVAGQAGLIFINEIAQPKLKVTGYVHLARLCPSR